jgi:hypothetical protein
MEDGENPLFDEAPIKSLIGKKVVPRSSSIRPFMTNGVFCFCKGGI